MPEKTQLLDIIGMLKIVVFQIFYLFIQLFPQILYLYCENILDISELRDYL